MKLKLTALFIGLLAIIFALLPWLFVQVADWQKAFNQLISENLHQIQAHSSTAGLWLIFAAFSYGVLHALGPGHGKFIIASYLSTHESQLKTSVRLSLLSSLMQGFVAVAATSIVVVILNLSSKYFKLSQLWLERSALILLLLLGIYWIAQGLKGLKKKQSFRITSIQSLPKQIGTASPFRYEQGKVSQTQCSCGHQHLPNNQQLKQSGDLKSQLLVILTIGMRPCSGAIFVLFLAYMLDLYWWGILATFAMSLGTGLMLSLFAALVRYARNVATRLGHWYGLAGSNQKGEAMIKCIAGAIMIFFALSLLYGTMEAVTGGAALFGG